MNQEFENLLHADMRPGASVSAAQRKAHEEDIWILITGIIVHLFEDNLLILHYCPAIEKREQGAALIWITIVCNRRCKDIMRAGIAKDPVVTSQMAEWMVRHSGKADAREALDKITKISSSLSDLESKVKDVKTKAVKAETTASGNATKIAEIKKKL